MCTRLSIRVLENMLPVELFTNGNILTTTMCNTLPTYDETVNECVEQERGRTLTNFPFRVCVCALFFIDSNWNTSIFHMFNDKLQSRVSYRRSPIETTYLQNSFVFRGL